MPSALDPVYFEELREQSQRCLVDFLNVEINLAFTFVDRAAVERDQGNFDHYRHTKAEARKAVNTLHQFVDRVSNPQVRAAIRERSAELERAIAAL